jgi:hypothetical protein
VNTSKVRIFAAENSMIMRLLCLTAIAVSVWKRSLAFLGAKIHPFGHINKKISKKVHPFGYILKHSKK